MQLDTLSSIHVAVAPTSVTVFCVNISRHSKRCDHPAIIGAMLWE